MCAFHWFWAVERFYVVQNSLARSPGLKFGNVKYDTEEKKNICYTILKYKHEGMDEK